MATILYVEDHPPAQLLMQAIISDMTTHRLLLAGSGEQARAIVMQESPDLYILDLDLPDTDGISLAGALKAIHEAPALLVSAYGESVKNPTINSVIYAYLAKPLDPINVTETIERALA